jgi:hypothetical protein
MIRAIEDPAAPLVHSLVEPEIVVRSSVARI